ncbi:Type II secretion system (T2SS), protein F [Amycolatopsis xylanica]|uniref:Type II secretion system (T2SS), protein F n=1 Tax=Amycolatopsis xylanica TaxID=589385 RepID=A0A1H2Z7P2_9PSEU|nr:type II secretion system F family protein [Amycolatopsis xylanica]SDX13346.1 Type II secretion system (T2SS), protein F [Amycolatopsis xylanica]
MNAMVLLAAGLSALPPALGAVDRMRSMGPAGRHMAWRWPGRKRARGDPLRLAAVLDLLAACLRSGLPVAEAVRAVTGGSAEDDALRATADLLELGADPVLAWEPVACCDGLAELARAARRTARSGTALAEAVAELAARLRASVADEAEARAQRVGVLITGPLGLCFLPAFFCLGVAPVVAGLTAGLLTPH